MLIRIRTCAIIVAAAAVFGGCGMQEQKQISQENAELKASLDQNKQMLAQCQAREKKQVAVVAAYQEKIAALEKRVADLEMLKVELRKQKEFTESEVTRQKLEAKKQAALAENYRTQVKTLNDQLAEARSVVRELQAKVKALSERTATKPAGK